MIVFITMRHVVLLLIGLLCFQIPLPVHAVEAPPPVPEQKVDLHSVEQKLKDEKQRQKTLKSSLKKNKETLGATKKSLVLIGEDIRENEKLLTRLGGAIEENISQQISIKTKLEKDYGAMSNLVLALTRMWRMPPEALIARPGAPKQAAQSAMLLQATLPAIQGRAQGFSSTLDQLETLQSNLQKDRAKQENLRESLAQKQAEMEGLLKKRKQLYQTTHANYTLASARIDRLSQDAKTIRELLARLAEEEKRQAAQRNTRPKTSPWQIPHAGSARLPVAGVIKIAYGQKDDIGAESKGVRITARKKALVTAPMGGIVRFAGKFKNYGNMVIIEHRKSYHSLIGGLGNIDVSVGESVAAGEPLGRMPSSASHNGTGALYYELRYKGQPVDPAKKLSKLKG